MNISEYSLKQIKELSLLDENKFNTDFIEKLKTDSRKSVNKLADSLKKQYSAFKAEHSRLDIMSKYEKKYEGKIVGGCDEAGRGPLAGPVVASVVILPENCKILGINDSKKLSEKKRDLLYTEIMKNAVSVGIGIVNHCMIDKVNILRATHLAVVTALTKLEVKPQILLTDALNIKCLKIKQESLIKGDSKSVSIAAASIIAKVTRDRIMKNYSKKYSVYKFDKNKGYGTAEHIEQIKKNGYSPIHRLTFIKNFI